MTDWGQAAKIGGVGFATVFIVLLVLFLVVLLTSVIVKRLHKNGTKPQGK